MHRTNKLRRGVTRKLIELNGPALTALTDLASDNATTLQALADEAFRDLLRKHGRPASLEQALRQSLWTRPLNDNEADPPARKGRR